MSELRWILIALGIALVAGIFWWSRRSASAPAASVSTRREPDLGDSPVLSEAPTVADVPEVVHSSADAIVDATVDPYAELESGDQMTIPMPGDPVAAEAPQEPEPMVADKIVKLHLVAREDAPYVAADVVAALRAEGLRFAHYDLFHRFEIEGNPGPTDRPLFSVSDMLKPGSFDLETLADKSLKGISLFLALPSPGDGVAAFADMLATGRRLAATLGGQLVDEQGCSVSRQSASHMREDIINYQLGARTSADEE
ncbi:MAG: cell division protein ZipA C-terminal FtsZ-binding domain-containing protein [Gammaproteobacteria bacterium]